MNDETEQDQVWDLLGHAGKVEPSPFFVRNVLREVRQLDRSPVGLSRLSAWAESCVRRHLILVGATASAALALFLLPLLPRLIDTGGVSGASNVSYNPSEAFDPASEMAAIEFIGQLMAVADPGQLDDASLAELFF